MSNAPATVPSVEAVWSTADANDQALLHMLATSTNDGIWDWDIETGRVYYSPRWLELIGETPGAVPEHIDSFRDRLHPEDLVGFQPLLGAYLAGEVLEYRSEFRLRHRDGSWRSIASRGTALRHPDGRAYRVAGTHTDVTDLRQAADRLERLVEERTAELRRARDQAELAAAATSKFLAATSHDIRQPLQAMAFLLGGLRGEVRSDSGQRLLNALEQSLTSSMEMLDGLLEFSRLEAGALRPTLADTKLDDLLRATCDAFGSEASRKGIVLRHVTTGAIVRTDALLLGRILRNLVSNAVKYTARGRVLIGCRMDGARIRMEVWDSGCGIAEDQQRQIFWEFFQVRRGHGSGLGLGLAIVERLTRLLGHELALRSVPGRGSVFSVTMKRVGSIGPGEAGLPDAEHLWIGSRLVAFLEDSHDISVALRGLLMSWGCVVVNGASLEALIDHLGPRKPDLVVADWHLADNGDGFDAIDRLEAHFGCSLPSLVLTGDYDFAALERVNVRKRRVIHKPVLPKLLHAVMRAELGGSTSV
jgi:PAS domain S-box-containing protein